MEALSGLSQFFAALTVAAQILVILFLISFAAKGKKIYKAFSWLSEIVAMKLVFLFSLASVLVTLYYSEILNLEPCVLCWYQRIFMYGILVLFAVALWRNDKNIIPYGIAFSVLGGLTAAYQYLLQMTSLGDSAFCSIFETGVSCSEIQVLHFGFVTIPLMSLTGFVVVGLLLFLSRKG